MDSLQVQGSWPAPGCQHHFARLPTAYRLGSLRECDEASEHQAAHLQGLSADVSWQELQGMVIRSGKVRADQELKCTQQ